MNGFRSFGKLLVVLLIFTLMIVVIGGLAKGVSSGSVDPKLLAACVTGFTVLMIVGAFAAVIRTFRRHSQHRKQASSAEILADIIAMKDEENKEDGKEDTPHGK